MSLYAVIEVCIRIFFSLIMRKSALIFALLSPLTRLHLRSLHILGRLIKATKPWNDTA